MLLAHEHQHNETMLQLLQMVDGYEPREPRSLARGPLPTDPEMVAIEPASTRSALPRGFAYDNERPRHAVELAAFEIDRAPVTNGAYIEFMEETGAEPPHVLGARRRRGVGTDGHGGPRPDRPGPSRHPRLLA